MRFRTLFLFFILAELVSYLGYFVPAFNIAGFILITVIALALSLWRLEYGLGMALAELILGGKGYLFSLTLGATPISLRMAIFIVVMAVWVGKVIAQMYTPSNSPSERGRNKLNFPPLLKGRKGGVIKWWGLFGVAIVWGLVVGLLRGNNFGDLFLDANGYFYAALVLPFVWQYTRNDTNAEHSHEMTRKFGVVFLTATTWLAVKTLISMFLYTHASTDLLAANLLSYYGWVRNTGVGEITWLPGNFARVFFQSHVYNVAAFLGILGFVISRPAAEKSLTHASSTVKRFLTVFGMTDWRISLLLTLNAAVIIVALSRSFWLGTFAGCLIIAWYAWRAHNIKRLLAVSGVTILMTAALLTIVARFPFPPPTPSDLGEAARARLQTDAAAQSRWNLLPPLWRAVATHPIVGSGFGKTVTYISNDPRIRAQSPTGEYTTYAFEWGWLDLWLKLGAVGLALYLGLLAYIGRALMRRSRDLTVCLAGFAVLVALATLSIFTPYLNHPLGFGLLALLTILPFDDRLEKVVF